MDGITIYYKTNLLLIVKRFLLVMLLLSASSGAFAVGVDSLFVVAKGRGWVLQHPVAAGENLMALARRYNVPPDILAEANQLSTSADIGPLVTLTIPLDEYNVVTQVPRSTDTAKPLYYRVAIGDNLYVISIWFGVSRELLTVWNDPLPPGGPLPGQVLLVGWVRYDPTSFVAGPATVLRPDVRDPYADTVEVIPPDVLSGTVSESRPAAEPTIEQLWKEQTIEGLNVIREKGTAGFFSIKGHAPLASVYAFHNTAARGTIMLVRNINNDRTVYVKVLGPLPDSKQYAGCVLGLSDGAKAALGARENKVFVEMSYAGY
jgi:LysM repeat protein